MNIPEEQIVVLAQALPSGVPTASRERPAPWAYLGRTTGGKERAESLFCKESFVCLTDRLQETAQMLMMPYIEAVGGLSVRQRDKVNWLASKFASRSIWQTEFFHRSVMTRLAVEAISTGALGQRYLLVIEDPWVFEALRAAFAQGDGPRFIGRGWLSRRRLLNVIVSPFKRIARASYAILFRLAVAGVYRYRGRNLVQPPRGDVLLHAYLEDRTIRPDGQYRDEYLGNLGEIAESARLQIVQVSHLFFPWRLIGRAASNSAIWPLILSLPYRAVFQCLFKRWRPIGLEELEIPGVPKGALRVLLKAERLAESGAGYMVNCLTHAAYLAYLSRRPARTIIYPFENQPWEKLLCWSARSRNPVPRLVGFQQSTVARFFVHFFRSRFEDERFFPDCILVGGERFAQLLITGGWNKERLSVCGALRHTEAMNAASEYLPQVDSENGRTVVVALPVDTELTREILNSLRMTFPDGGRSDNVKFVLRFHPAGKNGLFSEFSDWLSAVNVDTRPYLQTLKNEPVACVLTAMGASGLEALFMGLPVARFRSELSIEIDPLDEYEGDGVWVATSSSLRNIILDLVGNPRHPHPDRVSGLLAYFAPVNRQRVIEAIRGIANEDLHAS